MYRWIVNPTRPEEAAIERAAAVLRSGGVVAYPTETFYGLGASAYDASGCERVLRLKGRMEGKAFPAIIGELEQLAPLIGPASREVKRLVEAFWPGPLTLVLTLRADAACRVAPAAKSSGPAGDTMAVRMSGHAVAREIARAAACPITATSANRSGEPPARTAGEIEQVFRGDAGLDLILDGGDAPGEAPSTIVDMTRRAPRLVRAGPIGYAAILAALETGNG